VQNSIKLKLETKLQIQKHKQLIKNYGSTQCLEKSKQQTILDKNVKSRCILTKLCELDSEYIFERTTKSHYKIFISSRVIDDKIYKFALRVTDAESWTNTELARKHNASDAYIYGRSITSGQSILARPH